MYGKFLTLANVKLIIARDFMQNYLFTPGKKEVCLTLFLLVVSQHVPVF